MKNKKVILKSMLCATLFTSDIILARNIFDDNLAVKNLDRVLDSLQINSKNDTLFEKIYSYEDFINDANYSYECSENFIEYYTISPSKLVQNIIENTESSNLDEGYKVIDEKYYSAIEAAIKNSWENCPISKKDSFVHLIKELKIVEYEYKNYDLTVGKYDPYTKTITIYTGETEYYVSKVHPEVEDISNYIDTEIQNTIYHEFNHVLQDTCSCDKHENKLCFNNKTFWEANAEENNVQQTSYSFERKLYNLTMLTGIFNENFDINYFNDILVNNDIENLFNFFDAETDEEKYNIYKLLSIINIYPRVGSLEKLQADLNIELSVQLLKYYSINLVEFSKKNNINMEDVIYFFKAYLSKLLEFNNFESKFNEIPNDYVIIIDAFTTYLANSYGVSENVVKEKLISVDVYHYIVDKNGNIIGEKGIIPTESIAKLPEKKVSYLAEQLDISKENFFSSANCLYYRVYCNFISATNLINSLQNEDTVIYKKEK